MTEESNTGKSFADRFGKKPATTSTQLSTAPTSNASSAKKSVDPKKKMQADLIYLVKGVDAGRNAWYYVLVERTKVQLFLKALNDNIIELDKYSVILYSAYGDEPPSDITDKLKDEYGIDG